MSNEKDTQEFVDAMRKLQEEKGTPPPVDPAVPPVSSEPPAPPAAVIPPVEPPATPPNPADPPASDPPVEEPKNLLDLLKPEEPAAPVTQPTTVPTELSDEVKADIQMAQEYKALMKEAKEGNPLALAFLAGAKPDEILQVAKSLIPEDLSHLSYEQLIKRDFEKSGLTGELLDSAVKDTMAEYTNVPDWKKVTLENEMKDKFKPVVTTNPHLEKYQQQLEQSAQPTGPTPEQMAQTKLADTAAILSVMEKFHGAEIFGFKFDKDTIGKEIVEAYDDRSIQPYIKPDNSLDAQGWAIKTMWEKHGPKIAQAAYDQGRLDEKKGNVLPNSARKDGPPPTNITNPPSKVQAIAEYLNNPENVNKKQ